MTILTLHELLSFMVYYFMKDCWNAVNCFSIPCIKCILGKIKCPIQVKVLWMCYITISNINTIPGQVFENIWMYLFKATFIKSVALLFLTYSTYWYMDDPLPLSVFLFLLMLLRALFFHLPLHHGCHYSDLWFWLHIQSLSPFLYISEQLN